MAKTNKNRDISRKCRSKYVDGDNSDRGRKVINHRQNRRNWNWKEQITESEE